MNCVLYKTVTGRWTTVNSACIQCSDADTWNSMRFVWIVPTDACLVPRVSIVNFGYVWGYRERWKTDPSVQWELPTLAMGKSRESYGHIDLHAHCYAGVCIIHGEPKSNEERWWCVRQNRVAQTFFGKKWLRERGRLWTPRVKYIIWTAFTQCRVPDAAIFICGWGIKRPDFEPRIVKTTSGEGLLWTVMMENWREM